MKTETTNKPQPLQGFTPGEWFIETNVDHYPFIMGEDNNTIAMLFDPSDISLFYGRTFDETKSNAALIASAPTLLKENSQLKEQVKLLREAFFKINDKINHEDIESIREKVIHSDFDTLLYVIQEIIGNAIHQTKENLIK